MSKKQLLTNANIENDIADAIKYPPEESESSYRKAFIPVIIVIAVYVAMAFIYPPSAFWMLLAAVLILIGGIIFNNVRKQNRIKNVSINDYDVTQEVVYSVDENQFEVRDGKYSTRTVHNYIIRFESGRLWNIPPRLYRWSERLWMTNVEIHGKTHRGDTLLVVSKKNTDKIVVAYNTELFEYERPIV